MNPPRRTAALVFNPAAGRGADDLARLREALEPHFQLLVHETCKERDADICAAEAVRERPDLVIAAGGDGTVSLVAGTLVGTGIPLGIVGRGTSNSIATGLGIPTDEAGAVRNLIEGVPRAVDTARANGRTMVLHASVGFHAATIAGTPREAKNRWGFIAYVKEGLSNLRTLDAFQVEIETESETVRCQATNVTVANVAPLKTLLAQGPAVLSPDDGRLDVTIIAATGLAEAVATGLHLLRTAVEGEAASRENIGFLSARSVRVRSVPPQPLLIDGEDAGEGGDLAIVCLPASLHVIAPVEEPGAEENEPDHAEKLEGLPGLEVEQKARAVPDKVPV